MPRNITLNADDEAIETARALMKAEGTSLNEQFKLWLDAYIAEHRRKQQVEAALACLEAMRGTVKLDRMPTREERNARR
ncbi:MAG: hypothetical protein HOO93_11985 [Methyloglobulus sp.]|nr:hypothetical protein [Methyloglobulus sp.]